MEPKVLISVANAELRVQLRGFLREQGFHLVEAPRQRGLLRTAAKNSDLDLVLADACAQDSARLVQQTLSYRPAIRLLLMCSEPDYIGRSLIPDPRVAFVETPFAWCELRAKITEIMSGRGITYAG